MVSDIDINLFKEKLLEEIKSEEEAKNEVLKDMIESTTYKKGCITKEVFKLPMPSSDKILQNKNLDLRVYGGLMLDSKWGGKFLNPDDRYFYNEDFKEASKEVCINLNISESKLKRDINKLKKASLGDGLTLIQLCKNANGDIIYKLNYAVYENNNYKKYVTITNVALRILTNATNDRVLRIYLYLLYKCRDNEVIITQEEICERIGLSYKSRKLVTDCVNALDKLGFINIRLDYKFAILKNSKGTEYEQIIPQYYYSLSEDYLEQKIKN